MREPTDKAAFNATDTSTEVSWFENPKFCFGAQWLLNLPSSKPSFHRMRRDFLMELCNLSGNYWRTVYLKNV